MDNGIFNAYIKVVTNDSLTTENQIVIQPTYYELNAVNATVRFAASEYNADQCNFFRLVRGAVINGVPSTISSIWFEIKSIITDGKFTTLYGEILRDQYVTAPANASYQEVIETICDLAGYYPNADQFSYHDERPWDFQFYPTGRIPTFNKATALWTTLRQKYFVFATENGWDETTNEAGELHFFRGPEDTFISSVTDHTITDILAKIDLLANYKKLIWRDENGTTHTLGGNYPIHNLGYLESTDQHPFNINTTTATSPTNKNKTTKLQIHLKYRSGDMFAVSGNTQNFRCKCHVKEVFDTESEPAWYVEIQAIEYLTSTEGGPLPSTIEAAAPYTPLVTGSFDNILSEDDNNIQAAMDTLDDHGHADEIDAAIEEAITGLSPKQSVRLATAAALPTVTYSNGVSGVGATLTAVATGTLTIDGSVVALNDRLLIKDQAAGLQNGIYTCTLAGAVGVAFILTRATDNNTSAEIIGSYLLAEVGTANIDTGFINTNTSTITMGTTAITWGHFAGFVTGGDSHDHIGGDGATIIETAITLADNTTNDVTTSKHGFVPKAPNDTTKYLRGDATWATAAAGRELLDANKTYYVRTDGSDSNNGLTDSSGGAFLTAAKANAVVATIDKNGYDITVQFGAGTWSEDIIINTGIGDGDVIWKGTLTSVETATSATVSAGSGATAGTVTKSGQFTGDTHKEKLAYFATDAVYRVIASNTNDALTLADIAASSTTQDVTVYSFGTSINSITIQSDTIITLQDLKLTNKSSLNGYSLEVNSFATCNITRCHITKIFINQGSAPAFVDSIAKDTVSGPVIAIAYSGTAVITRCFVIGTHTNSQLLVVSRGGYCLCYGGTYEGDAGGGAKADYGTRVWGAATIQFAILASGNVKIKNCDVGTRAESESFLQTGSVVSYTSCTTNSSADATTYAVIS